MSQVTPKKLVYVIHGDSMSGKGYWKGKQNFPQILDEGSYSSSGLIDAAEKLFAEKDVNTICIEILVPKDRLARRIKALTKRFNVTTIEFRRHN